MKQIYHNKNETFEIVFYEDKERTKEIKDFSECTKVYLPAIKGDVTPLLALDKIAPTGGKLITVCVPYLPKVNIRTDNIRIQTFDDLDIEHTPPKDSTLLFLSEEDCKNYGQHNLDWVLYDYAKTHKSNAFAKKVRIFLRHGTKKSLKKAKKVARVLLEKYGVEEVSLSVLHWFQYDVMGYIGKTKAEIEKHCEELKETAAKCGKAYPQNAAEGNMGLAEILAEVRNERVSDISKIITTNSTGILEPQKNKRLEVIDCFDLF